MSKPELRDVEFYSDGQLIRAKTDVKTARAIGMYKDVYNKIEHFDITSKILNPRRYGFVRKAFQAQSPRLRIICIKEYLPDVPEILEGAIYECGVLNKKTHEYQAVRGGVEILYYKLFNEHSK